MLLVRQIDNLLNRVTTYRLMIYGLLAIIFSGLIVSLTGQAGFSASQLAMSALVITSVCIATNQFLLKGLGVTANYESTIITSLLLVCVVQPVEFGPRLWGTALVGLIAIASKYIAVFRHQHLLNPVAAGALTVSLLGLLPVTWWIATPLLLPVTLVIGLMVVRKTRHGLLFGVFMVASLSTLLAVGMTDVMSGASIVKTGLLSWPLVFFGAMMLTEPATMPASSKHQIAFAALVGVLITSQLSLGNLTTTPQLALVAGNILAFALTPTSRLVLSLKSKQKLAPQIYDFVFQIQSGQTLSYQPGQYLDWTLPLPLPPGDNKGNRRTFTIASSPTEKTLRIGIKVYDPPSDFKKYLSNLPVGGSITASRLGGHFVLPVDAKQPLIFIAGGIGITPFRSMIKYLTDIGQTREITLFHLINDHREAVYREVWREGESIGLKTRYVLPNGKLPKGTVGEIGQLSAEIIGKHADLSRSRVYISGPPGMVDHFKSTLLNAGCRRDQIVTDFFAGY